MTNTDVTQGWQGFFYDFTADDLNLVASSVRSLWFLMVTNDQFLSSVFLDEVSLQVCTEGG